jgi:hypothetical protein
MLTHHSLLLSRVDCSYRGILEQMLQELNCEPNMVFEFNSVAANIIFLPNLRHLVNWRKP